MTSTGPTLTREQQTVVEDAKQAMMQISYDARARLTDLGWDDGDGSSWPAPCWSCDCPSFFSTSPTGRCKTQGCGHRFSDHRPM